MAETETRHHPETGAELHRGVRPLRLSFGALSRVIDMPGWYAKDDTTGETGLYDRKDMIQSDRAINALKAESLGRLLPAQIRRIRQRLGLSQKDAGHIIGGGPNAFQKYEAGDVLLSEAADTALRLLAADPARLNEIMEHNPV